MRIRRETLLRIAKETAITRTHADKHLIAAYLTGSLLSEEPFLGGAADIDLVFIHDGEPAVKRKIVALTPEIHLDLAYRPRRDYASRRELRLHPWLGAEMYASLLLWGSEHFFEYVQAIVRDKFHEPANILLRARRLLEHARQIWTGLQLNPDPSPAGMRQYLKAVGHAANAIALLHGPPLAERRFLLQFPARAEAAGRPGLAAGLLGLLGAPNVDASALAEFLPGWEKAFLDAAGRPKAAARITAARLGYYKLAMEAMIGSGNPQAILWPLIQTWTLAAAVLPPTKQAAWQSACEQLGLSGAAFETRLQGLDQYLDEIEEMLAGMAAEHGL